MPSRRRGIVGALALAGIGAVVRSRRSKAGPARSSGPTFDTRDMADMTRRLARTREPEPEGTDTIASHGDGDQVPPDSRMAQQNHLR